MASKISTSRLPSSTIINTKAPSTSIKSAVSSDKTLGNYKLLVVQLLYKATRIVT